MKLRNAFLNNFGWKLLSFVLAAMTWFAVATSIHISVRPATNLIQRIESRTFPRLPITVLTAASDVNGFKVEPPVVSVTVNGSEEVIQILKSSDITAYVNLVDIKDARELRKRILITLPPGVSVTSLSPPDVRIEREGSGAENF